MYWLIRGNAGVRSLAGVCRYLRQFKEVLHILRIEGIIRVHGLTLLDGYTHGSEGLIPSVLFPALGASLPSGNERGGQW